MKNPVITLFLIGVMLFSASSVFSQKKKPNPVKKQKTVASAPSRGFGTTITITDLKGEHIGQPVKFGINLDATYCVDMKLGESFVPPLPPSPIPDVRFLDPRDGASCMDLGISNDYRPYLNATQVDTYLVNIQPSGNRPPLKATWTKLTKFYNGSVTMSDNITGTLLKVDMKKTTSAVIPPKVDAVLIIAQKPFDPLKVK
jgi:hypothetical protein